MSISMCNTAEFGHVNLHATVTYRNFNWNEQMLNRIVSDIW